MYASFKCSQKSCIASEWNRLAFRENVFDCNQVVSFFGDSCFYNRNKMAMNSFTFAALMTCLSDLANAKQASIASTGNFTEFDIE